MKKLKTVMGLFGSKLMKDKNFAKKIFHDFTVLPTPVKSNGDKNRYKVIRLQNGLTACLVSQLPDESSYEEQELAFTGESSTAEAVLCIDVGHLSNSKEVPGLAHLLEHVVMLKSKKYPQESDFDVFLAQHGGFRNGSTYDDHTTFDFVCYLQDFYEALNKFAQYFIAPSITKDLMMREREAVDCEYKQHLEGHSHKINQLMLSFAKKSSPVNNFSCGNSVSLQENIKDDDLFKLLNEFRERHYSAHRMTLVVEASLPFTILERYVVTCFSDVPNNGLPGLDLTLYNEKAFDTPQYHKMIFVKPHITKVNNIHLTWMLSSGFQGEMNQCKAILFVDSILTSHEDGSLSEYLIAKSWITNPMVSRKNDFSLYTQYSLLLKVTNKGYEELNQVIETIFGYIELIKTMKPMEHRKLYEQLQSDQRLLAGKLRNKDLARNMQIYRPQDYLTDNNSYPDYNENYITSMLNRLVPNKLNVLICSSVNPDSIVYDQKEFWYKTQYAQRDIPSEWMEKWKSAKPISKCGKPTITGIEKIFFDSPYVDNFQALIIKPQIELWHKKNKSWKTPLVKYDIFVEIPVAFFNGSLRSDCMFDLFIRLIKRDMKHATVSRSKVGFCITCTYSDNFIRKSIRRIAVNILNLSSTMTKTQFNMVKDLQMEHYEVSMLKSSYMCNELSGSLLLTNNYTSWDKLSALQEISFEDMKKFIDDIAKEFFMVWRVEGNADIRAVKDTLTKLLDILNYKTFQDPERAKTQQIEIPNDQQCRRALMYNKSSQLSTVNNYYHLGLRTTKSIVMIELIKILINPFYFKTLRTQEQLGYYVHCRICHNSNLYNFLGIMFTVETRTEKFSTEYIDARIEAFLENQFKEFQIIGKEIFLRTKKRMQALIFNLEKVEMLKTFQFEEVVNWWRDHLTLQGSKFNKISFQVVGAYQNDDDMGAKIPASL